MLTEDQLEYIRQKTLEVTDAMQHEQRDDNKEVKMIIEAMKKDFESNKIVISQSFDLYLALHWEED